MPRTKVGRSRDGNAVARKEFEDCRHIVGRHLRAARMKNQMSQAEAAARTGHVPSWMTEVEQGRSNLYVPDLWALAKLYGFPIDYFFSPAGTPSAYRVPENLPQWEVMFSGDAHRASLHWAVDNTYLSAKKASA